MIYRKFFGFREEPFGVTPDPKFLCLTRRHEEAIAHLRFGISENKGFVMLTGEVGAGKTTLIRHFLNNIGSDTHTSLILNPMFEPLELLKLINHDFGIACEGSSYKDLLDALNNFLLECFSRDEKAVLIIDEAQGLSFECLEFMRLLSNLETNTKKLLQVVLVGQPELTRIVESERLKQLNQRIAVRYHLEFMDLSDTIKYINHRLKVAGSGTVSFPDRSIRLIYRFSHGCPRLINLACDRTFLLSYSKGKAKITTGMVRKALRELGSAAGGNRRSLLKPAIISLGALSISLVLLMMIYGGIFKEYNLLRMVKVVKEVKNESEFFLDGGIYRVSKPELSEAACILNLLSIWGEKDIGHISGANSEIEKRGFFLYKYYDKLDKIIKFDMPGILGIKDGERMRWVVLRWVIGEDAMLIDPLDGKKIVPLKGFKDAVTQVNVLWKNKYNGSDRIERLQAELKRRGLYNYPITGILEPNTANALIKFQEREGIVKTGLLDDETAIILSRDANVPKLILH